MLNRIRSVPNYIVYANSVDMYVPEFWANESIEILKEKLVMARLVHRDFSNELRNFGDTVNTRKPAELTTYRKTVNDNVTIQDVSSQNIPVTLNQMAHVSFMIRDGEQSLSFKNLITEYMEPAMLAISRFVDQILMSRLYGFLANSYGLLGGMTNSNTIDGITGLRAVMNRNKAHLENRHLILTPNAETAFLRTGAFTEADKVGDAGSALRTASLGNKFGFNLWMSQNAPSITTGNTAATGEIDLTAGYPAGTTTVVVDGFSAALSVGTWFTIAGDAQPHRVVSTVGGSTPTSITFTPALASAVLDNADIATYTAGAVNQSVSPTGYAAGYAKEITVDAFTVAPQVGQMVTFGTATDKYGIIDVNGLVGITLDRPLEAAIADDATVHLGPPGDYNFAFHRNALALVIRPFAPVSNKMAQSAIATDEESGISIRVTMTYNGEKQGTLVTLDMLCGTAILEEDLGAVLLS